MELWEVLDDNGNPTGEIMEKYDKKVFDRGLYHLGAEVWIINNENKILIQKRSEQKRLDPNVWATTGGSVILRENSKETIVRETKEELDIDINPDELKLVTKFKTGNVWIDTYILKHDYDISKMKFKEDEVSDVKWVTLEEINTLVNNGEFIKYRWEFVNQFLKEEIQGVLMENKLMKDKIIYETENFIACVPYKTHISREDGGHIWIRAKEKYFASRLDLTPNQAIEVMRLSMLISEAMIIGMRNRGINIARINYQENGNWAYLKETKPVFHIHLYGRTKESKVQIWGEALKFPNPDKEFYDNFTPFNDADIEEIKKQIKLLENTEKYKLENWK